MGLPCTEVACENGMPVAPEARSFSRSVRSLSMAYVSAITLALRQVIWLLVRKVTCGSAALHPACHCCPQARPTLTRRGTWG